MRGAAAGQASENRTSTPAAELSPYRTWRKARVCPLTFFSLFLALWALRGKMGWGRNTSCMFTTPWPGGRQSPAPGADGPLAWVQRAGSCSLRLGNESCVAQTRRRRQRTWGCAFTVTETETEQL